MTEFKTFLDIAKRDPSTETHLKESVEADFNNALVDYLSALKDSGAPYDRDMSNIIDQGFITKDGVKILETTTAVIRQLTKHGVTNLLRREIAGEGGQQDVSLLSLNDVEINYKGQTLLLDCKILEISGVREISFGVLDPHDDMEVLREPSLFYGKRDKVNIRTLVRELDKFFSNKIFR